MHLARELIARFAETYQKPAPDLSGDAITAIMQYPWPGNVRELENAIQRALILCEEGNAITQSLLSLEPASLTESSTVTSGLGTIPTIPAPSKPSNTAKENLSLEDYFQQFVLEHQDHMSETELAKQLGVSRKCLWERRQKFGIPRKKTASKK